MSFIEIRVSEKTHLTLKHFAQHAGMTVGETIDVAVRRLIQSQMGQELSAPLDDDENQWQEADLN